MDFVQDRFRLSIVALIYFMTFVVLSSGCKKLSIKSKVAEEKHRATLFDQLIAKSPDGNVPYPFSKLLSYLSQYAVPVPILIPISRSQQRHDSSFKDPRRVVGFRAFRISTEQADELNIHARLFLGYVKKSQQIEVMSLATGRNNFDFQVIDNYNSDGKPVVKPANKNNCLSCHQQGGPIFTPNPWAETNFNNNFIVTLLKHSHPGRTIDDIPLDQPFGRTARDFEALVRNATDLLLDHKIWSTQCEGSRQTVCRVNVLKNLFSLHRLVMPVDFMLRSTFSHAFELMPDRNMTIILPTSSKKYLKDYPLSAQATSILNRIITEEDKKYAHRDSPRALIATYIRGEGMIEGQATRRLQQIPALQEKERRVLYREMANIIMHIHRKDLHINTIYDPITKRKDDFNQPRLLKNTVNEAGMLWTLPFSGGVSEQINRLKDIFVQQTILPKNKRYWHRSALRSVFLNTINVEKTSAPDQIIFTPFFDQALLKAKTKDAITYVRADITDPYYLSLKELTVHIAEELYAKPKRVSKAVFTDGAGRYEFDLLCRADPAEYIMYTCSAFDQWQIETAIMSILQDKNSSLYHNYLQPRVLISEILSTLGYSTPIKQETQQQNPAASQQDQAVYVPTSQDKVGQSLYQHCGDCHANRNDEYNFLYVSDAQALCTNIRLYVNSVELQKSKRNIIYALTSNWMPPNDSTYADEFSQTERNALINALKETKLPFCK